MSTIKLNVEFISGELTARCNVELPLNANQSTRKQVAALTEATATSLLDALAEHEVDPEDESASEDETASEEQPETRAIKAPPVYPIFIILPDQKTRTYHMDLSKPLRETVGQFVEEHGIPIHAVYLLGAGRGLELDGSASDYGITKEMTIRVMVRFGGLPCKICTERAKAVDQ